MFRYAAVAAIPALFPFQVKAQGMVILKIQLSPVPRVVRAVAVLGALAVIYFFSFFRVAPFPK